MSFQWPAVLILLLILPAVAGLYVWMQTRRRRYALRYASVSLVSQAVGRGPGIRRHIPPALYLVALGAMIVALARPTATIPMPQNTGTVVLLIDVSGSMQAEDVEPNRMEATKDAVRDFVNKQPRGVKIGVVTFSDFGALIVPPTRDKKSVVNAVGHLRPQRGTNIGSGLQVAIDAILFPVDGDLPPTRGSAAVPTPTPSADTKVPPASIVLLSDGQTMQGPPPLEVAQDAVDAGIKIYTIGIGTPEGTNLMIQGRSVFTRLDEPTLREIADRSGGAYFSAQSDDELDQVYDELARERLVENEETEITFLLTGVALMVSMLAGGLGLVWFNRLP